MSRTVVVGPSRKSVRAARSVRRIGGAILGSLPRDRQDSRVPDEGPFGRCRRLVSPVESQGAYVMIERESGEARKVEP